jgi:hypothetical protein
MVERTRHKLKRLVNRGLLAEPRPGLFVTTGTPQAAEPATTAQQQQQQQQQQQRPERQ